MRKLQHFQDLDVWKNSHQLCLLIYKTTRNFPSDERFGLTAQMKRASSSIVFNTAEGFSRMTLKDKRRFYITSKGSLSELQSQILIARDLGYLPQDIFIKLQDKSIRSAKMLTRLIQAVS